MQEVRKEIPVLSTKIEVVKEFVDRIVIQEKFVDIPKDDCDCISEYEFVTMWNRLMNIKFAAADLKDECLSSKTMVQLIMNNMKLNEKQL